MVSDLFSVVYFSRGTLPQKRVKGLRNLHTLQAWAGVGRNGVLRVCSSPFLAKSVEVESRERNPEGGIQREKRIHKPNGVESLLFSLLWGVECRYEGSSWGVQLQLQSDMGLKE